MIKSRGTSTGAVTIVQDDDLLGQLQYQGTDGTTAYTAAITKTKDIKLSK